MTQWPYGYINIFFRSKSVKPTSPKKETAGRKKKVVVPQPVWPRGCWRQSSRHSWKYRNQWDKTHQWDSPRGQNTKEPIDFSSDQGTRFCLAEGGMAFDKHEAAAIGSKRPENSLLSWSYTTLSSKQCLKTLHDISFPFLSRKAKTLIAMLRMAIIVIQSTLVLQHQRLRTGFAKVHLFNRNFTERTVSMFLAVPLTFANGRTRRRHRHHQQQQQQHHQQHHDQQRTQQQRKQRTMTVEL